MFLGNSFEPRRNSRVLATVGSVMTIGLSENGCSHSKKPVWQEKTGLTSPGVACGDLEGLTWFRQSLLFSSSKEGYARIVLLRPHGNHSAKGSVYAEERRFRGDFCNGAKPRRTRKWSVTCRMGSKPQFSAVWAGIEPLREWTARSEDWNPLRRKLKIQEWGLGF